MTGKKQQRAVYVALRPAIVLNRAAASTGRTVSQSVRAGSSDRHRLRSYPKRQLLRQLRHLGSDGSDRRTASTQLQRTALASSETPPPADRPYRQYLGCSLPQIGGFHYFSRASAAYTQKSVEKGCPAEDGRLPAAPQFFGCNRVTVPELMVLISNARFPMRSYETDADSDR